MNATAQKYDATARMLHWVSAAVILWASISGLVIATQNVDAGIRDRIASFNVSITTVFIPFFVFRIWHRIRQRPPAPAAQLSNHETRLAGVMHVFLYVVVGAVLISGVLMMRHDISLFQLVELPQPIQNVTALRVFRDVHTGATMLLGACIALHLVALAKHEITGKRILKRML